MRFFQAILVRPSVPGGLAGSVRLHANMLERFVVLIYRLYVIELGSDSSIQMFYVV